MGHIRGNPATRQACGKIESGGGRGRSTGSRQATRRYAGLLGELWEYVIMHLPIIGALRIRGAKCRCFNRLRAKHLSRQKMVFPSGKAVLKRAVSRQNTIRNTGVVLGRTTLLRDIYRYLIIAVRTDDAFTEDERQ